MAYEITIKHLSGSRATEVQTFTTLPVVLGRADDADVRFDADVDLKVSAKHAEVRQGADGGLELHDLGATNGLFLDGERVEGSAPLPTEATVEVGAQGPRVKLRCEHGVGVSFGELRKRSQKEEQGPSGRPLASTEASMPTYDESALAGGEGSPPAGLDGRIVGAVVAVVVVAVVLLLALG